MTFIKKLILSTILILGVTVAGFAQETEPVEKEPTFFVSDALMPYVETYFKALRADGWDLRGVLAKDFFVVLSHEVGRDNLDGAAGIAEGMNNDEIVLVTINTDAWVKLEGYAKQDLINHELMHDIFNVYHTPEEEENRLMHPSSYPNNWGDTISRLVGAISDLNEANGY